MTRPRINFIGRLAPGALRHLVDTSPRVRDLVQSLRRRHNLSEERARTIVERMVGRLLNDFGDIYTGEMVARLDRIMSLRDQLERVYRSIGDGQPLPDGLTPNDVSALFTRLDSEMRMLQSAGEYAKGGGLTQLANAPPEPHAAAPDVAPGAPPAALPRPTLAETISGQTTALANLDAPVREAITQLADRAPDLVRRVVNSEDERSLRTNLLQLAEFMRREGRPPAEIDLVAGGLSTLNLESNRARRAARPGRGQPYDPNLPEGQLRIAAVEEFNDFAEGLAHRQAMDRTFRPATDEHGPLTDAQRGEWRAYNEHLAVLQAYRDPAFFEAVRSRTDLARLLHENPIRLAQEWQAYVAAGRRGSFGEFVTGDRMRVWERARVGEYAVPFNLGEDITMLKAPDYNVNVPGTDLISLNRRTDEILIIDNKAYVEMPVVDRVTAMVQNLESNMADDVSSLRRRIDEVTASNPNALGDPEMIGVVRAANRLDLARQQISSYLATNPGPINSLPVQQRISAILLNNGIRRVVTNAAGASDVRMTSTLQNFGFEFRNMGELNVSR